MFLETRRRSSFSVQSNTNSYPIQHRPHQSPGTVPGGFRPFNTQPYDKLGPNSNTWRILLVVRRLLDGQNWFPVQDDDISGFLGTRITPLFHAHPINHYTTIIYDGTILSPSLIQTWAGRRPDSSKAYIAPVDRSTPMPTTSAHYKQPKTPFFWYPDEQVPSTMERTSQS